jgi:mono/diheme cytochrome c family protein
VRRTAADAGAAAVVLGSLAILATVALRARREAVLDAFLVGIAVSLLVNDTPSDVAGIGAAIAVVLARHPITGAALDSAPMRRAALVLAALALLIGLAGCGGGEEVSPTPETVIGTLPEETTEETTEEPTSTLEGDASNGESVYASAGCGGCHTLEAAGSSGTVGPNLDDSQPDFALVVDRVTNGAGAMPAFEGQLSEQEIADVAAYVVESTSG